MNEINFNVHRRGLSHWVGLDSEKEIWNRWNVLLHLFIWLNASVHNKAPSESPKNIGGAPLE